MSFEKIIWVPNKSGLYKLLKSPAGDVGMHMRKIDTYIKTAAKRQVGKNTRLLELSIGSSLKATTTGQELKIGSPVSYALAHHNGTRAHVIRAHGGMLRFTQRGRIVYRRQVMHPGTRPNRYLTDHLWYVYK